MQIAPAKPSATIPGCAMWDRAATQISATIFLPGTTRNSNRLENAGARRYRLKILTGVVDVSIHDMQFAGTPTVWQVTLLGTTAAAARAVFNFGEGTGIAEYLGPFFRISLFNSGGFSCFVDEVELWAQW